MSRRYWQQQITQNTDETDCQETKQRKAKIEKNKKTIQNDSEWVWMIPTDEYMPTIKTIHDRFKYSFRTGNEKRHKEG